MTKKRSLKFLGLMLCFCFVASNSHGAKLVKNYSSSVNDLVVNLNSTSDGGYILSGYNGNLSIYPPIENGSLIKVDSMGAVEWQKIYVNNDRNRLTNVVQTSDGGYIATVYRPFDARIAPAILRVDQEGNVLWCKSFAVGGYRYTGSGNIIEKTSDNGYLITLPTATLNYNNPDSRVWLIKINDEGVLLWQKLFDVSSPVFRQCADGGIILGVAKNDLGYGAQNSYPGLVKLDANGNIVWQKLYKRNLFPYGVDLRDIQQTRDGGFIAYGVSYYSGLFSTLAIKFDASGNIVWQKNINHGSSGWNPSIYRVFALNSGEYLLGSSDVSHPWLFRFDGDGNLVKFRTVESYHGIFAEKNGEILIVRDFQNYLGRDFRIIKTESDGTMPDCAYYRDSQVNYGDFDLTTYNGNFTSVETNGSSGDVAISAQNSAGFLQETIQCISAIPNLFISEGLIDFGPVEYGDNETQTILLANDGTAPLTINSIVLSGQDGDDITFTANCPVLSPGASCSVEVAFAPSVLGPHAAALLVNSNDPDQPVVSIPLSGTGIDTTPPVIALKGEAVITVEAGTAYNDPGATAQDNYDGDLSANLVTSGLVNVAAVGGYEVAFNVVDSSGNHATEVVRTIYVVDTIPPVTSVDIRSGALWPPKKAKKASDLVPVTINGTASDSGVGVALVEIVVTDEYGVYNYHYYGFGQTLGLEAWREGSDSDGRVYTIDVIVTDLAGNTTNSRSTLVVGHDYSN